MTGDQSRMLNPFWMGAGLKPIITLPPVGVTALNFAQVCLGANANLCTEFNQNPR